MTPNSRGCRCSLGAIVPLTPRVVPLPPPSPCACSRAPATHKKSVTTAARQEPKSLASANHPVCQSLPCVVGKTHCGGQCHASYPRKASMSNSQTADGRGQSWRLRMDPNIGKRRKIRRRKVSFAGRTNSLGSHATNRDHPRSLLRRAYSRAATIASWIERRSYRLGSVSSRTRQGSGRSPSGRASKDAKRSRYRHTSPPTLFESAQPTLSPASEPPPRIEGSATTAHLTRRK